jgi:hypothetical protein
VWWRTLASKVVAIDDFRVQQQMSELLLINFFSYICSKKQRCQRKSNFGSSECVLDLYSARKQLKLGKIQITQATA